MMRSVSAAPFAVSCRHGQSILLGLVAKRRIPSKRLKMANRRSIHDQASAVKKVRNIGIIAHVDAGKTTTTERMLYYSGATRFMGSVDEASTVTDYLPMERQKGITIQSAAVTMLWPPREKLADGEVPTTINLIDTPGHQDFGYEVIRSIPELDGVVMIMDASRGVETNTEKVWKLAREYRIPSLCYLNKHDGEGASVKRCVYEIANVLGTRPLVCQIPLFYGVKFVGQVDVINEMGMKYTASGNLTTIAKNSLPQQTQEEMVKARLHLVETLAEADERMMEVFLEHEERVPSAAIKQSIRTLIRDGRAKYTPIFCGASKANMGVQPLLDAIVDYLPSPDERSSPEISVGSQTLSLAKMLEAETGRKDYQPYQPILKAVGHVFKVVDHPRYGMISFVRVYHGTLVRDQLWNTREGKFERPNNILHLFGEKTTEIVSLETGHIGALTGLKSAKTGDTLIRLRPTKLDRVPDRFRSMKVRRSEAPPSVAFVHIEAFNKTGKDKMELALKKVTRTDPSLRYHRDLKTDAFVFSGLGTFHLEIARERLRSQYQITKEDVQISEIQVEYQECVLVRAGPYRELFDGVLAGRPGKAAVTASIEPLSQIEKRGGNTPLLEKDGNFIGISMPEENESPNLDFGDARQVILNGVIAGLLRGPRRSAPVRGVLVRAVFDPAQDLFGATGNGHIQMAAMHAVRAALREAHARGGVGIMEPFMLVRIVCPESLASAVQHDLKARRGAQVLEVRSPAAQRQGLNDEDSDAGEMDNERPTIGLETLYAPPDPYETLGSLRDATMKGKNREVEIVARAPFKEMMRYSSHLRNLTSGRESLSLEPADFALVAGPRLKALEAESGQYQPTLRGM